MISTFKTKFGAFRGKQGDGVLQFRGIKYAKLKDQISIPEMMTTYGEDVVDATKFGHQAPAIDGCALEQSTLIQCSIGVPEDLPPISGTECLNLNITVPETEVNKGRELPVMVFIHGGGFIMGANHWPQYDPSRFVKLSTEVKIPIVAVNINYRLGVLGNLTSQELRDAGYPGNNALRDQKCALQWVKAHIAGFGGDPEHITVFGESAGAAAVLYQLQSEEPLFKRCISMSGTPIMLKPLPLAVTESSYTSIIKELGLENSSMEERIETLKNIDPDDLVKRTPMSVPLLPFLDGEIVHHQTTFEQLQRAEEIMSETVAGFRWCEELMIGDCQHDGNVFLFMGLMQRKAGIADALAASLHKNLSRDEAAAILNAYKIDPAINDDKAMEHIIDLATDIAYFTPALVYARAFPGNSYYYQFNEPNPWDGPFKGCSTHLLDAAFLFQNFNEQMNSGARQVAKVFATDFLNFANGVKPWAEFERETGIVRSYGPGEKNAAKDIKDNGWGAGRRDALWKLSQEGKIDLDQVSVAWDLFLAGM